ncbi:PREDICTED: zinc finger FYVE domain-containing protein 1-like isoform X2 [Nicrophorus vespilloides]|uniref:Zinc finger FYVE domain-containing protein 1-like isoform X2 n=1 Tax=Nicrophorus vespilloides TaxID=110193 RepID=A0ABM1NKJ8_NICVS|nr:PREDICTED: zinc finger FYVE domain-containing protein 1-like isoform X2 [Nicrophorus vespilloides]
MLPTQPSTTYFMNKINSSLMNRKMDSLAMKVANQCKSPIILDSIDYPAESASGDTNASDLKSLNIHGEAVEVSKKPSFLLIDENETLRVGSVEQFLKCLKIVDDTQKVKVVAIFGNTGEGKSYTLNQIFFDGREVFQTSAEQSSCTMGVWAAYDPNLKIIALDTEGLLGVTKKESQRTRLLLKILAVSDVIIYRTRTERLQRDMYTFLGGASKAYKNHFQAAIQQAWEKSELELPPTGVGPSVIIFHETIHTNTLQSCASVTESAEDILRCRFAELKLECDSFSSFKYIGVQSKGKKTSFAELKNALHMVLENTTVRSKRKPSIIYLTLKGLNDKFSNEIKNTPPHLYLKEYFTCQVKCQACNEGCKLSMGHKAEGEPHFSDGMCKYQRQFQNRIYLCKKCYTNGDRVVVKCRTVSESTWTSLINYVWSGSVIECKNCSEIYRSRQHWYGNKGPEEHAVISEPVHVWPGEPNFLGSHNSAQRVLDGVNMISDAVVSVTSQPTKVITDWVTDKIAPTYWVPNHEITHCHKCEIPLLTNSTKHHCRECGEGFCDKCSSRMQPVPSRGWTYNVRVCDNCYKEEVPSLSSAMDDTDVRVRKYGEAVVSSITAVASVLEIPKGIIKENARPTYWTPDNECHKCEVCNRKFCTLLLRHHCRDCGKGVCDDCSNTKKPVPLRGWYEPVRVCDNCLKK